MNKYFKNILIIDGSYMLHRSLKTPDLWNLKNSKGVKTGGVFGFFKSLFSAIKHFNYFPIVCWDSGLSPRRLEVYPNYKKHFEKSQQRMADKYAKMLLTQEISNLPDSLSIEDREAVEEAVKRFNEIKVRVGSYDDPDDYSTQYISQRDYCISIGNSLGIPSILCSKWEGDDLITLITRISENSVIVSDDKDMYQLLAPTVSIFRAMAQEYMTYEKALHDNGINSSRVFVVAKAISGDPSDNIPSVTSQEAEKKYHVGEVFAKTLAKVIVEEGEIAEKYIKRLREEPKSKNKIEGFIRNIAIYERNMKLVDLSLVQDDLEMFSNIVAEVKYRVGKANLFDVMAKFSDLEITSIDVNSLVSAVKKLEKLNFGK